MLNITQRTGSRMALQMLVNNDSPTHQNHRSKLHDLLNGATHPLTAGSEMNTYVTPIKESTYSLTATACGRRSWRWQARGHAEGRREPPGA